MAIIDLYSKRQKVLHKEVPDVYRYDEIPTPLRAQMVHILRDLFGFPQNYDSNGCTQTFEKIHDVLSREYGVFQLSPNIMDSVDDRVIDFLINHANHEQALDVIEISLRLAFFRVQSNHYGPYIPEKTIDNAVAELNTRFDEHGIGYQYESGDIIRVDSQLIHAEVVKPTLVLLAAPEYAGANAEFLKAFEHYRKGDTKECLNECLKAFESTMKAICKKRSWTFNDRDTASALIDVCMKNNLVPAWMQTQIGSVRASLESGIATIRNRMSGHGQGATVVNVPAHYASYMLHLTATTIKFLIESEKALP